ncbi:MULTISPECIES: Na+/H+ antiporter NhaA [unclassified Kitasatospora]|uniref:Na+/H+ antiporter NhaA n=1 Tax=unclassified Kitasatospora TaxID=2633591 RepID=UPI000709C792|nr:MULTISPECIES: Na+/H+ antiporter NhaA [unclassified Kitasatospora]KQV18839.1 sodium:proton antiporter [Kitasatospora sp. Root107]KRB74819.1 sodium:proton antiporter [Kitasatospora sp. Root187]
MATPPPTPTRRQFLGRLSLPERTYLTDALRTETVGGILLLLAAAAALLWANLWPGSYDTVREYTIGPSSPLHLDLSLDAWAKDGLLTIFFFVAGIELKREFVAGELRSPSAAMLPVVAAVCGVALPAIVYAVANSGPGGHPGGWAIPTATDIAFALGVLAVVGSHLPSALRAFLLTLAVVDDLIAILIIAVFYSSGIEFWALGLSVAGLVLFWFLHRHGVHGWYLYVPLAFLIWALMHESGVHATVSGVAMGLILRCHKVGDEKVSPGEHIEHQVRPLSAGFAVPVFALFAAGVSISGPALGEVFTQAAPLGIVLGLLVGKTVGIFGGTWLAARFTRAELNPQLRWADLFAVSTLAGIGFTVSLLISELAFPDDPALADRAKAAVLVGSLLCALVATVLLKLRNRHYQQLVDEENLDSDNDGIPDVYQQPAH